MNSSQVALIVVLIIVIAVIGAIVATGVLNRVPYTVVEKDGKALTIEGDIFASGLKDSIDVIQVEYPETTNHDDIMRKMTVLGQAGRYQGRIIPGKISIRRLTGDLRGVIFTKPVPSDITVKIEAAQGQTATRKVTDSDPLVSLSNSLLTVYGCHMTSGVQDAGSSTGAKYKDFSFRSAKRIQCEDVASHVTAFVEGTGQVEFSVQQASNGAYDVTIKPTDGEIVRIEIDNNDGTFDGMTVNYTNTSNQQDSLTINNKSVISIPAA